MSTKLPGQFSEADLLDLLKDETVKESSVIDSPEISSPVKFLTIFNITPGKHKVRTTILYDFYRKWAGKDKVSQSAFTNAVQKFIPYSGSNTNFSINEANITLSQRLSKEILKTKPQKRYKNKLLKQHIDKYIADCDLRRGTEFVDVNVAHIHYWNWAMKSRKSRRIPLRDFVLIMRLYFVVETNQHGIVGIRLNKQL
jgi:hypothetical protein